MEMKKMKTSSEPRDRLSELPDSLIYNIFEFLPMNDIVRTQILSHRWENLWTFTPYLYFVNVFGNSDQFRNFVNRSLLCWKGKKIQKLKISSDSFDKSFFNDIDLWVRFAVNNGVEVLETYCKALGFDPYKDDYHVPKCLYSCPSLQKLQFWGSMTKINENGVQWNRLKSLDIFCFSVTRHAIDLVLSKCLLLEVFILTFIDKGDNLSLSFQSSSLKKLLVHPYLIDEYSPDMEMRIWTPNLEILIIDEDYCKCLLMNVSSLTHATLPFEGLTISDCCIKVLGATSNNGVLSPMPSVVYLNLYVSFEEHEQLVGFLEIFPKLKTLVIKEVSIYVDPKSMKNFKPNPSKSFLVELRTVDVTWNMSDLLLFPLIEILLKYASKLEKMVFRAVMPIGISSISLLLKSQTKLLRMPRSSPTAELIFCVEKYE